MHCVRLKGNMGRGRPTKGTPTRPMPRMVVILQRRSAQVAALSPVQWADTAPVPRKLDLHPLHPHLLGALAHDMQTRPEAGEVGLAAPCASVCRHSKKCD